MAKRTKSKKTNPIVLALTPAERDIFRELFTLDEELAEHLNPAANHSSLSLSLEEWEIVAEAIADEADQATSKKRRNLLQNLSARVEDLLKPYYPDETSVDEPIVIDLSGFGPAGPKVEPEAIAYLHQVVEEIFSVCSDSGIPVAELAKSFAPLRVDPQEKIGVRLTGSQREILLQLPEIPKAIKSLIQNTPARKQKVEMVLTQVHELENAIADVIQKTSDRRLKRLLQLIDGALIDVQVHYTDGNDTLPSDLKLALQPHSLSRGALVRQMLTQMVQSRLPKEKGQGKR